MTYSSRKTIISISVCFILIFCSCKTYSQENTSSKDSNISQGEYHDKQEYDIDDRQGENSNGNGNGNGNCNCNENNHTNDQNAPNFVFDPCRDNPNLEGCNGVM